MATNEQGLEIQVWDSATQRAVERVNVRGDIYRHVLMGTQAARNLLRQALDRGLLSPPASRYEVRWVVDHPKA